MRGSRAYTERYNYHHSEAVKDIERANERPLGEEVAFFLKRAHVHAMLAVAAATASGSAVLT